jgi:type IX secretion system PorP/SprF family membrane protein
MIKIVVVAVVNHYYYCPILILNIIKDMKKLIFILTCIGSLLATHQANAQQDPLFAQYNSNAFLINPAIAGSKGNHSLNLFHRWQWVSFPGSPQTFGLNYQGLIKDLHGVGALLFGDVTGPSSRYGGKVSYAFHIPLADRKMRLSIGLAGRFAYNVIRTGDIQFIDQNDRAVANADGGVGSGDAELGFYFYSKNLSIGLAAPNLIQTKIDFGNNPNGRDPIAQGYRHYFLNAGYKFRFPEKKMILEPSIMVKYVQGSLPQIDGGITLHVLDEALAFGLYYRSPAFLSFQAKFLFDKKIPVLIGFDVALNNFQQYSTGSTELMIGYEFAGQNMFQAPVEMEEETPDGNL